MARLRSAADRLSVIGWTALLGLVFSVVGLFTGYVQMGVFGLVFYTYALVADWRSSGPWPFASESDDDPIRPRPSGRPGRKGRGRPRPSGVGARVPRRPSGSSGAAALPLPTDDDEAPT
jgi:hypothetical protein